jgi:flavin reductase (DIM6/NTAB) family NADH-FMN oxidoreductase RutF
MNEKIKIDISRANRLLNFGPVVLVTAGTMDISGLMAAAWAIPVSHKPSKVCVSIAPKRYTASLISKYKEFSLNISTIDIKNKVLHCGSVSGKDVDKFESAKLTKFSSQIIKAPLVSECVAHIECKVSNEIEVGDHVIYVGDVVSCLTNKGVLDADGIVDLSKFKILTHLGGEKFASFINVD